MFKRRTRTLLGAALVPLAAAVSGIITDGASLSGQTFDYVVVGGGLAGMAVAGRLSEDAGVTVLVIEAGGDSRSDPDVYDSNRYGYAFGRPDLLWTWDTVEGKGLMGGRTLGGSTAINGMTYTRGQAVQYDSLAELLPGASAAEKARWSWDGMLAAMKKAEGFSAPNADQQSKGATSNPAYHGASGPVQVTFPSQMHGDQMKMFQQVMNINFSVPTSQDPAGGDAAVVSFFPNTINWQQGDRRSSSVEAYYTPVESTRRNIAILINNRATKILTTGSNNNVRATGVEYATGSVAARYNVVAAKEVIVAAGAVQSPALLQLSGIGDSAKLTALGITPVINLPGVGKNLQDQTMSNIGWPKTQSDGVSALSGTIAYPNIDALFSTSSRVAEIKQMIQSSVDQYATDAAAAGALVSKCAGQVLFGAQADMMVNKGVGLVELFFDNGDPNGGYGIKAWNLLPFARGSVDITSADPFAALRIQTRYFSAEVDKTIQIQGARMARQAFKSAPLRNVVTEETMPGFSAVPDNAQGGTDADWWSNIESNFLAVNHQIATCSMMDETFGGVVDANLRVYHTTNIRVVDASVLPHQISAHLSATLYGIAENAADIIKAANQ